MKSPAALRIGVIYAFTGVSYIVISDFFLLENFLPSLSIHKITYFQTIKGTVYVILTAILLYWLIAREMNKKEIAIRKLGIRESELEQKTEELDQAYHQLERRNKYIEEVLTHIPIGMAANYIDNGKTFFMNDSFNEIYGWDKSVLDSVDSFFKSVYPDKEYRRIMKARIIRDIESGDPDRMKWNHIPITTKSGDQKVVNAKNIPIPDENIMISTVQDVTELELNNQKLAENQKWYQLLSDNMNDIVVLSDEYGTIEYYSPSIRKVASSLPKTPSVYELIHPEDVQSIKKKINNLSSADQSHQLIRCRVLNDSNESIWYELNYQPVFKDDKLENLVFVMRDISHQVEKENEIMEYQEKLQGLTIEILSVEERQRKEVASNIHDHLIQLLALIKQKLNQVNTERISTKEVELLELCQNHLNDCLNYARKITHDLTPPILYEFGLIEAIKWLGDKLASENNIEIRYVVSSEEIQLPETKLIFLFRIVQELLYNVLKHAKANLVEIRVEQKNQHILISVEDDGIGLDAKHLKPEGTNSSGFGLFSVKERVQNLKGNINIDGIPGKGTNVNLKVPL